MFKNLLKGKNKDSINKKLIAILIAIYFIILIWVIVFKCNNNASLHIDMNRSWSIPERLAYKAIPFKYTFEAVFYYNAPLEIIALLFNISCFVPLAALFRYFKSSSKTVILCAIISLSIEVFQLFSGWGGPDVSDIVLNTLGAVAGVLIYNYILTRFSTKMVNSIVLCLILISLPLAIL